LGNSISSSPRLDPTQTLYHFDHFRHWTRGGSCIARAKTFIRLQMDFVVDELPVCMSDQKPAAVLRRRHDVFARDLLHAGRLRAASNLDGSTVAMARAGWRSRSNAVDQQGMEIAISRSERIKTRRWISRACAGPCSHVGQLRTAFSG